jgi:glucose-1-phosphate thymidylyltransferase
MFAIIPAAGKGTRLRPLTDIAPKPLLPVYNKPMIFYPLLTLQEAGVEDIIIIVDDDNKDEFETFFKDGHDFGLNIQYVVQKEQLGIAHAIGTAENVAQGHKIIVIHGDNIFEDNIKEIVDSFEKQSFILNDGEKVGGGKIILTQVQDPTRFGIAELEGDQVVSLEEKPQTPKSNWATAGLYMFDERVFDIIKTLKPSKRGEYEITDIADFYLQEKTLTYNKLKGKWFDVGTIDALHEASDFIAENKELAEKNFEYIIRKLQ